jgi:hypothetical protein
MIRGGWPHGVGWGRIPTHSLTGDDGPSVALIGGDGPQLEQVQAC